MSEDDFISRVVRQSVSGAEDEDAPSYSRRSASRRRGSIGRKIKYALLAIVLGASAIYGGKRGFDYYNEISRRITTLKTEDVEKDKRIQSLQETLQEYEGIRDGNAETLKKLRKRNDYLDEEVMACKRDYIKKNDLEGAVRQLINNNGGIEGTWVVGTNNSGVYLKHGEAIQQKRPVIKLNVFIDTNSNKGMDFYKQVLTRASDNLYSNFNIRLEWGQERFFQYTSSREGTNAAFEEFLYSLRRDNLLNQNSVPYNKGVYILFYKGEEWDKVIGMGAQGGGAVIVDSHTNFDVSAHTVVHELGHVFDLTYNNGDRFHLDGRGFVMSAVNDGSMIWDEESRRQMLAKLNSGGLDYIITYR